MVVLVAAYASVVAANNLIDYDSNFQFVQHVLSMDTTFPDNSLMSRNIESPILHHAAYAVIIAAEIIIALLCWIGGIQLWKNRKDRMNFIEAKKLAGIGLSIGIILWFGGFVVIGGEWFLMWQSETYNGQAMAMNLSLILGIFLLFLYSVDDS